MSNLQTRLNKGIKTKNNEIKYYLKKSEKQNRHDKIQPKKLGYTKNNKQTFFS